LADRFQLTKSVTLWPPWSPTAEIVLTPAESGTSPKLHTFTGHSAADFLATSAPLTRSETEAALL
jgi:hypothetical protein